MARLMTILTKTAAQWTASNKKLRAGQVGLESDTGKQKIGDNVTRWNDLAYVGGAGGASSFTDLTDATDAISAKAVLIGNAAGTALECALLTEYDQANNALTLHAPDPDTESLGVSFGVEASNAYASMYALASGYANIDVSDGVRGLNVTADGTKLSLTFSGGAPTITGLPTSNPNVANALWNDAGTLKISAG